MLKTHLPYLETSLEGPIPGCNRLQICGLFARFCRDWPSYLVEIVDVAMSPVQFENRRSVVSRPRRITASECLWVINSGWIEAAYCIVDMTV